MGPSNVNHTPALPLVSHHCPKHEHPGYRKSTGNSLKFWEHQSLWNIDLYDGPPHSDSPDPGLLQEIGIHLFASTLNGWIDWLLKSESKQILIRIRSLLDDRRIQCVTLSHALSVQMAAFSISRSQGLERCESWSLWYD